jgi:hypothetical protein
MPGCGFCAKAKYILSDLINSGDVSILPSSSAPRNVSGFPYFENPMNGMSYTGCPKTVDHLLQNLNLLSMINNLSNNNIPPKVPTMPTGMEQEDYLSFQDMKKLVTPPKQSCKSNGMYSGFIGI